MVLKVLLGALVVLFIAAAAFFLLSLALLLLVPAAFPALGFGFTNAMALAGIVILIGLPAMRN